MKSASPLPVILFAVMGFSFASCNKTNDNTQNNDALTKEIDRICDSVLEATKVPGIIVGIWSEEKNFSYLKAFGYSNLSTQQPMSATQPVRIGSNTKTFTVTTILQLVDSSKLSLEDTIGKFFPGFKNGGLITVRMLCDMTSGIPNYLALSTCQDTLKSNPAKVWTPMELVNLVVNLPFKTPGGDSADYSNTNTVMLGMIIEQVTGKSLAENFQSRFFTPLGLHNTIYPTGPTMPANSARGYQDITIPNSFTDDVSERYDPSFAGAAGALISDVNDVKTWVENLVSGNLISAGLQSQRFIAHPEGDEDIYGLGMFSYGKDMWGHNGGIFGYSTIMMHHRTKKITYVIFLNWYNPYVYAPDYLYFRLLSLVNPEL